MSRYAVRVKNDETRIETPHELVMLDGTIRKFRSIRVGYASAVYRLESGKGGEYEFDSMEHMFAALGLTNLDIANLKLA